MTGYMGTLHPTVENHVPYQHLFKKLIVRYTVQALHNVKPNGVFQVCLLDQNKLDTGPSSGRHIWLIIHTIITDTSSESLRVAVITAHGLL